MLQLYETPPENIMAVYYRRIDPIDVQELICVVLLVRVTPYLVGYPGRPSKERKMPAGEAKILLA